MTDLTRRDSLLLIDLHNAATNLAIVLHRLPAGDAATRARALLAQAQAAAEQAVRVKVVAPKVKRRGISG